MPSFTIYKHIRAHRTNTNHNGVHFWAGGGFQQKLNNSFFFEFFSSSCFACCYMLQTYLFFPLASPPSSSPATAPLTGGTLVGGTPLPGGGRTPAGSLQLSGILGDILAERQAKTTGRYRNVGVCGLVNKPEKQTRSARGEREGTL